MRYNKYSKPKCGQIWKKNDRGDHYYLLSLYEDHGLKHQEYWTAIHMEKGTEGNIWIYPDIDKLIGDIC